MSDKQVISKQRVTDYGEVYTHPREVNAMLDLREPQEQILASKQMEALLLLNFMNPLKIAKDFIPFQKDIGKFLGIRVQME